MPKLTTQEDLTKFKHLSEVYVDDYIGLLQSQHEDIIQHHSRALLHAMHQIFPPPAATGRDGEDPISHKKLITDGEGVWDTRKEILGWIFDRINRTMELPDTKAQALRDTIHAALRTGKMELKACESLLGKCQHACTGIPGGKSPPQPPLQNSQCCQE